MFFQTYLKTCYRPPTANAVQESDAELDRDSESYFSIFLGFLQHSGKIV